MTISLQDFFQWHQITYCFYIKVINLAPLKSSRSQADQERQHLLVTILFFGVWKERGGQFAELPEWTQRAAMQVHAQIRKLYVSSVIPISFCVHWCTLPAFLNLFSSIHLNVYKFTNLVNFRISARSNFINLYFYNNVRKLTKFQRTSLVCESTR